MKTLRMRIGLVLLFLTLSQSAIAASTASTNANATAVITGSITITKTQDLQFGTAAPSDVALVVPATSGALRASFSVTGNPSTAYTITIPAGSITMINGAGATANEQIAVNAFTSSPSGTGTLSAGGTDTLYVGATRAAVLVTQTAGSYSGSFTVTVNY